MIPKAGDIVDINPKFKEAYRKAVGSVVSSTLEFGEDNDGHIHVISVSMLNVNGDLDVAISKGGYYISNLGLLLDFKYEDLESHGFDRYVEQFFIPVVNKNSNAIVNLKQLNSRPGINKCAKCNGPLKEPWLNIKFCPVCES